MTLNINADTQSKYIIDIVDEGQNSISSNTDAQIQQKIIKNESNEKEVMYQLEAKNMETRAPRIEVAIAIDSSFSMSENADTESVKQKAKNLAQDIINNVPNAYISISSNNAVNCNLTRTINSINSRNTKYCI